MKRLANKRCVITGAARGIGAAIAEAFVAEGAEVTVTDRNDEAGRTTAARLESRYVSLDVSREEDWARLAEDVPAIDVLVNNAGMTGFENGPVSHDPEHATLADWRAVHAVNLDGTFLGCRYAIGAMRHSASAAIINIASRSGMVGIPTAAAYASSKAAIRNHTKTVALYCAEQGLPIRCNVISPAAIRTPMWEPMLGTGPDRLEREKAFVSDTPLRRFGEPGDIAALAVLLASDEATYMTGAELTVDGGLLAGSAATPEAAD